MRFIYELTVCLCRMTTNVQGVNPLFALSAFNLFFYLLTPAIVLWYVYFRMSRKQLYDLANKIPGSEGLPLLGNALDFMQDPHSEYNNNNNSNRYGDVGNDYKLCVCFFF